MSVIKSRILLFELCQQLSWLISLYNTMAQRFEEKFLWFGPITSTKERQSFAHFLCTLKQHLMDFSVILLL